jgi:hypothetical protein
MADGGHSGGVKVTLTLMFPVISTLYVGGRKGATSAENLRDSPSPVGKEPSDFCPLVFPVTHQHTPPCFSSLLTKNHINILVLYTCCQYHPY